MSRFLGRCFLAYGSLALVILSLSVKAEGLEEPLGERGRRAMSSMMGLEMPSLIALAANADVQARLKPPLSHEQKAKIADLARRWRTWTITEVDFVGGRTPEERQAAIQSYKNRRKQELQAFVKELEEMLKPPQFAQLKEIAAGIPLVRGPAPLANPDIAAAVGVSDDSQKKIAAMVEASYRRQVAFYRESRDRLGPTALQEERAKMMEQLKVEINEVLSDEEKALVQKAVKAAKGIQLYSPSPRRGQPAGSGGA